MHVVRRRRVSDDPPPPQGRGCGGFRGREGNRGSRRLSRTSRVLAALALGALVAGVIPAACRAGETEDLIPGRVREILHARPNPVEHPRLLAAFRRDFPQSTEAVLELFEGRDPELALGAADALGALGDERAVDSLRQTFLAQREPELVDNALGGGSPRGFRADAVSHFYRLRLAAASALARIAVPKACDAMDQLFREGDLFYERTLARERVFDPATGREESDPGRRQAGDLFRHTARELAGACPGSALETFNRARARQPQEFVRAAATLGLAWCIGDPGARATLQALLAREEHPDLTAEIAEVVGGEFPDKELDEVVEDFADQRECVSREIGLTILLRRTDPEGGRPPYRLRDGRLGDRLDEALSSPCFNLAAKAATLLHRLGRTEYLLQALRNDDRRYIADHFVYYVLAGREGTESVLVDLLESHGTAAMAEIFLLCGNDVLQEAATRWRESGRNARKENDYQLSLGIPIHWGALAAGDGP